MRDANVCTIFVASLPRFVSAVQCSCCCSIRLGSAQRVGELKERGRGRERERGRTKTYIMCLSRTFLFFAFIFSIILLLPLRRLYSIMPTLDDAFEYSILLRPNSFVFKLHADFDRGRHSHTNTATRTHVAACRNLEFRVGTDGTPSIR